MRRTTLACAALALVGICSEATAQSHPLTTEMTCDRARSLVAKQGAIVLNTSASAYERYVTSSAYCGLGERAGPAWAPTRDVRQCPIGSRCVPVSRGSGF